MIRKEVTVSQAVVGELRRIVEASEILKVRLRVDAVDASHRDACAGGRQQLAGAEPRR
jgi:hypothetical protein